MIHKKGSLVLVPFPFTDLSGQKIRPALVISKNTESSDLIVVFISSKIPPKVRRFDIIIKPDKDNGIKTNSLIKCSKIATLDAKVVLGKIGFLNNQYLEHIDKKIKNVLGLH